MEGRSMYLFRSNFLSCLESTEIWHAYSFCVKRCPCFFFKKAENMDQIARKSTPPPLPLCLSPNIVGFRLLRTTTLCMCVFYAIGGGGGGGGRREVDLQERVWSLIYPLVQKKQRDIFWHKKSRHAKFQQIPSNLKNRNKIGTYASFPQSPSIL